MTIPSVGIELARNAFAVHGVNASGAVQLCQPEVARAKLNARVAALPPCTIGMEACSGAHHWTRQFQAHGHTVRLMAPKLFAWRSTARIMVKWQDAPGGRLTDGGGVRKSLTAADKRVVKRGFDMARRVLQAAGATDIYKTWYLAAHPGGSVKIGHLLDTNLNSSIENLYVCDCSVIPEAWGLPPSLTLVSLGKRLARHLVAEQQPVELPLAA